MGFPWFKNTITKTRDSICCFKINSKTYFDMKFLKLNDGRIILYNEENNIQIYRISNNIFSLELKFEIERGIENKGPYIIYEIDKNIILLGATDLFLIDLKRNLKLLQKININNIYKDFHILKLSNGLIIIFFSKKIIIFNYDKKEKKLIKKDEFDIQDLSVKELSEINNENIIIYNNSLIYILNLKTKEIKKMKINKHYSFKIKSLLENYCLISYLNGTEEGMHGYLDIYKIDLEEIKLLQTIDLDYPYLINQFIKLNENKLIALDIKNNIYEFNIADNFHISLIDIFNINDDDTERINIYKYNENKIIAISINNIIKIWEFD